MPEIEKILDIKFMRKKCSDCWLTIFFPMIMFLGLFPVTSSAVNLELSGAVSEPPGTWINSLYWQGSPINGVTIKIKTEIDWEYSAFIGNGFGLLSIDKIVFVGKDRIYAVYGASSLLSLNLGLGLYIVKPEPLGVRLQYVNLVSPYGNLLGANTAGPLIFGWSSLLISWKF